MRWGQHCKEGGIIQHNFVISGQQLIMSWKEHGLCSQIDLVEFETQLVTHSPFTLGRIPEPSLLNFPHL